jgi:hypothetical protein
MQGYLELLLLDEPFTLKLDDEWHDLSLVVSVLVRQPKARELEVRSTV